MVNNPFLRYVLSPLLVLLSLVGIEFASRHEWFTVTLALPVGVMALCLFWSGLRANLVSATFVTAYALYSSHFDPSRTIQLMLTVWPVAVFGGLMRKLLIESATEAEHYRLKAIDTLNGNRKKMEEALEALDLALASNDMVEIKKQVQIARIKQADTLTLVSSWHEIAQEQQAGIEKLERAKRDKEENDEA